MSQECRAVSKINYCDLKREVSFSLFKKRAALWPPLIYLASTRDFNCDRSAACLAISVARMQPMTRFLIVLN